MNSDVIRRWVIRVIRELDSLDVLATFQESFADPMHSIHDASVTRKDDRIGEITIEHKADMLNDLTAR
jgi:hypothetical protein